MEMFIIPKEIKTFVAELFRLSLENGWTVLAEYSDANNRDFFLSNTSISNLPAVAVIDYDYATPFSNFLLSDDFIVGLISITHALSVYNETERLFHIADDYHEECFSCTNRFYGQYFELFKSKDLVNRDWKSVHNGRNDLKL